MKLFELEKFAGQLLVNVLAKDEQNAKEIFEAGEGYIVPGIAAADFPQIDDAIETVLSLKKAVPAVSIGLGGGGSFAEWKNVLDIAVKAKPAHINQPFEKAPYAKGYLAAKGVEVVINALVSPTGQIGKIRLATGAIVRVEEILDIAKALGILSIKVMPVGGLDHLDELIYIAKEAAKRGIRGIEPAGGIKIDHLPKMFQEIQKTNIELFMPHIFGDVLQSKGQSDPLKIRRMMQLLKGEKAVD